jgi:DNA primase catalytic core, N-terminal domain
MIDTSGIDIKAVIDQLCCVEWGRESTVSGKHQVKGGPCPLCHQGRDRFIIWPYGDAYNPNPRFYCGIHGNGCGAHGDVISFVQQLKGYQTAREAIRDLYEMGFVVGGASASRYIPVQEKGTPSAQWQKQGQALVHAAQKYLWLAVGTKALDYLHKRGLTDETIKQYRIGYWPQWQEQRSALWGLVSAKDQTSTIWIRSGIIIPTFERNTLWKITIRILEYTSKELASVKETGKHLPRYRQVPGSCNSLFNVDAILPVQPVFLTEGEFDAMLGQQETDLPFVATGSTSGSMLARWITRLGLASHLLLAFDNDGGKGAQAAQAWCKIFADKALLWLPTVTKDVTDMWLQQQDIKLWASIALTICSAEPEPVAETHAQDVASPTTSSSLEIENAQDEDDIHQSDIEYVAARFRRTLLAWIVAIEPRCTLAEHIIHMDQAAQAAQAMKIKPTLEDHWVEIRKKLAKFDPKKPVNWAEYGYKCNKRGRWYYARRDDRGLEEVNITGNDY